MKTSQTYSFNYEITDLSTNPVINEPGIILEGPRGYQALSINDKAFNDNRELFLIEEVNADSCNRLIMQLMYLDRIEPGKEIKLFINSPGGSVTDGLALYDVIRMLRSPLTCIVMGTAASMASIILLSADKGRRFATKNSKVMIHDASFSKADFSGLKPDEIAEKAKDLLETSTVLRELIAERTGMDLETVTEKMKKDSYFKSEEAIEFGLIDAVIDDISKLDPVA